MIVTITLNPALDLSMEVPEWDGDDVHRATWVQKAPGGKGINVARQLKEFGDATTAVTILGSDSVQEFRRLAREYGFPIVYINIPGEIRTNIHIVDPKTGKSLKVNQPGTPVLQNYFQHFQLLYRQQMKTARMVAVGGSLPPGLGADTYRELLHTARKAEVPALIDAVDEPLLEALGEKPLIAKPNRKELESTLGITLNTPADILGAARELQRLGARGVIVTDGANPTIAVYDKEAWTAQPPAITVRGATGAGDTLAAGLLSRLTRGDSFEDAFRFAIAAGTACCLTREPQLARAGDIQKIVPQVVVKAMAGK